MTGIKIQAIAKPARSEYKFFGKIAINFFRKLIPFIVLAVKKHNNFCILRGKNQLVLLLAKGERVEQRYDNAEHWMSTF